MTAIARDVTIKEYFPLDYAARDASGDVAPRSRDSAKDYAWGLERFMEEAQILARFTHPNIVRVYRCFRARDTGYMVLHFEEGGSLKAWLRQLQRAPRLAEEGGDVIAQIVFVIGLVELAREVAERGCYLRALAELRRILDDQ